MVDGQHDQDIRSLIDKLLTLEYERGRLTAQLDFHLRLRDVHAAVPTRNVPAPNSKKGTTTTILAALTSKPMTARQLSEHLGRDYEATRQAVAKLVKRDVLVRTGHTYSVPTTCNHSIVTEGVPSE